MKDLINKNITISNNNIDIANITDQKSIDKFNNISQYIFPYVSQSDQNILVEINNSIMNVGVDGKTIINDNFQLF